MKLTEYTHEMLYHEGSQIGMHYLIPTNVIEAADNVIKYAIHLSEIGIPDDFEWWAKFRTSLAILEKLTKKVK